MSTSNTVPSEPVGQILPGPAHISGEISERDPQYTGIIQQMQKHGDMSTIGGTLHDANGNPIIPRYAGNLNEIDPSTSGSGVATSTAPQTQSTTETYSSPPGPPPAITTTTAETTSAPASTPAQVPASSGFGSSSEYTGFQQSTDTKHHGNAAQELLAHSGAGEKDMFGRRRSSATPAFHEPSDGRRVSTSGYEGQYRPSSFTRTDDVGYTTNPLGGADVQETSTGGAKMVAGRGYLVTGDTGAEGYTSGALGDFTETGPGGGDKTEGGGLKSRIAGLMERADERKGGTSLHSQGF